MEIISGVERRRRWRPDDKLRILAEIDAGARLADVARRYDVSRGLLWQWRDARRRGLLTLDEPGFLPVRVLLPPEDGALQEERATPPQPGAAARADGERSVEIALPDGTVLRVAEGIGLPALRRLLSAVRT